MTEQTATQNVPAVPAVEAVAPVALPAPVEGDTKRAYLVRHGLAVAVDKNGVAPRGRFSKDGTAAIDAAEAAGFVFADAKPARKPRVAKTVAPKESVEAVADVTPATVDIQPLPAPAPIVRDESEARGFTGLRKMFRGR